MNVGVDDGGVPTPRNAISERIAVNKKFISKLCKHFDVDFSGGSRNLFWVVPA